jgi:hypothetical protein
MEDGTTEKRARELVVVPVHEILRGGPIDKVFRKVDASLVKTKTCLCLPPPSSAAG